MAVFSGEITDARAIVVYGAASEGRNVAWSAPEDRNDWTVPKPPRPRQWLNRFRQIRRPR